MVRRSRKQPIRSFVEHWESFYPDTGVIPDAKYLEHLKWRGGRLTEQDVRQLFRWKAGRRNLPSWSPEPTVRRLAELNSLRFREAASLLDIARELSPTGLVKRFYVCHIVSPLKYPIWDRKALAGYLEISKRSEELDQVPDLVGREDEYESYRSSFNKWARKVSGKNESGTFYPSFRRLDRALWARGDQLL